MPILTVQYSNFYLLFQLKYGKTFYMDYVEILIDKGTDLELTSDEQNTLELMAGIEDKGKSLISLVEQKRPQLLRKHANSLLRQAVKSGSLETVKVYTGIEFRLFLNLSL